MSEDAKFVLVGANDAPWYLWDQSAWYWAMGVFGVFWFTLIVVAVILFIRTSRRDLPRADDSAKSALDIRYAHGAIDRGEYLERKRGLV
jgi:uncharacterized membrane protein